MGFEKKHSIYTAEDIQKYLSGKLTPAEMHAMEKAALEDIFLAEAIEGYHAIAQDDWERQLKLLKYNFQEKQAAKVISIKRPTTYSTWKVAAAVILLCSGIAITYMLTNRDTDPGNSISAITSKKDSLNPIINEQGYPDTQAKQIEPLIENNKNAEKVPGTKADNKPVTDKPVVNRPENVNKIETPLPTANELKDDQPKERTDLVSKNAVQSAQQNKPEQFETKGKKVITPLSKETENFNKAEKTNTKTFKAQAVGPDGSPLPFANIRFKNNQPGTYADVHGNFTLLSTDSLLNIEIKSKGYISGNFTINSDNPTTKFLLKTDETALKEKSLEDVQVTGYGTKRRKASIPDTVINVVPEDGWDKYEIYIANNLALTNNILQKKIHGEVIISFEVQNDGSLKNLKVEKSLCEDCDDSALRVIKEGPRWKIINHANATGKVKVKF